MIEVYIDQVVRLIPPDQQEEVADQLRARIYRLLDGRTDQEAIDEVLEYLGDAVIVANEYDQSQFLIGPRIYKSYTKVLKLMLKVVLIISAASSLAATLIAGLVTFKFKGAVLEMLKVLPSIISLLLYTVVLVTVFFVFVERYMKNETKVIIDYISSFQLKDLWLEIKRRFQERDNSSYFSRIATIVHLIIGSVLLTMVIFFGVLVDYQLIDTEFINYEAFKKYQMLLSILLISYVTFNSIKLIYKRWDSVFATINVMITIFFIYIATIIYRAGDLINSEYLEGVKFWLFGKQYVLSEIWPDIIFFLYLGTMAYAIINAVRGVYQVIAQNIKAKKLRKEEALNPKKKNVKKYRLKRE